MKRTKNTKTKLIEKKGNFKLNLCSGWPLDQRTPTGNKNKNHHQKTNFSSSQHFNYITIRLLQTEITQPTDPFSVQQKSQPLFPQLLT